MARLYDYYRGSGTGCLEILRGRFDGDRLLEITLSCCDYNINAIFILSDIYTLGESINI